MNNINENISDFNNKKINEQTILINKNDSNINVSTNNEKNDIDEINIKPILLNNSESSINNVEANDIFTTMDDNKIVYNNWTENNINTVRTWKRYLFKYVFIYNYVSEKYKSIVNNSLIFAIILGYLNSIINGISTALLSSGKNYIWLNLGLSISTLVLSTLITIINSVLQIKGWSKLISSYSVFIDKIEKLYTILSNLLTLPNKLKTDAVKFIEKHNKQYLDTLIHSPNILPSDYIIANKKYIDHIKNQSVNFIVEQKYGQNDCIIDIV